MIIRDKKSLADLFDKRFRCFVDYGIDTEEHYNDVKSYFLTLPETRQKSILLSSEGIRS